MVYSCLEDNLPDQPNRGGNERNRVALGYLIREYLLAEFATKSYEDEEESSKHLYL
jgi:hypothetical protein